MKDSMSLSLDDLHAALVDVVGQDQVSVDPELRARHSGDWSEAPHETPALVITPRTPDQVAMALACCSRLGQRVVVQGGLTGLAGGANPLDGEVVLSLHKLNSIEQIDNVGGTVVVQAGVVLEALQQQLDEYGWHFPLDLGARGSCQLGGNAATNAGGNRVIRYGTMRDLVLGLEVALPDGRLLTMLNRVIKNTTGVDLKHLFIGAEGSLGVITRLVLQLSPKPSTSATALCAMNSFESATKLLRELKRGLPSLSAFEVMWADFMDAATEVAGLRPPFGERHPVYVLIETQGDGEDQKREQLELALSQALETELVSDAVISQSVEDSKRLWEYREAVAEMISRFGPIAAFDVGIPMAGMGEFVAVVKTRLTEQFPEQSHLFFGHVGDGNLHVMSGPHLTADSMHRVEEVVYSVTRSMNGAISAEHGIGVVKKEFLHCSRSQAEIDLMRDIKALVDPAGILNAGRIFEASKP